MTNVSVLPQRLIVFGILAGIAIIVGYALATPNEFASIGFIALLLSILALPILLQSHHTILIGCWYAAITVVFLPGRPSLWMVIAIASLTISVLGRLLDKSRSFIYIPSVSWLLFLFGALVVFTAYRTGGLGFQALGSSVYGGRRYAEIIVVIIGFFALTAKQLPVERSTFFIGLYLLPTITVAMSTAAYLFGPAFYWLFWIFPAEFAMNQALADFSMSDLYRMNGLTFAAIGPYLFMLARFGVRGVLDLGKPWRLLIVVSLVAVSLAGGFRSMLLLMVIVFAVQFWLEGLHRTRLLLALAIAGAMVLVALIPISNRLPLAVQRSLSFIPFLEVNPIVRYSATASTNWRLEMWAIVWQNASKYLLLGKGYAINPTEMYLATQSVIRGLTPDIDLTVLVGNYHNGPLSVYVPFGLPGVILFALFLVAALRVLRANYRYGNPQLRLINTFMYGYFIARVIFFVGIFGAIELDFYHFVGLLGLSMCLNGGARTKTVEVSEAEIALSPEPAATSEAALVGASARILPTVR